MEGLQRSQNDPKQYIGIKKQTSQCPHTRPEAVYDAVQEVVQFQATSIRCGDDEWRGDIEIIVQSVSGIAIWVTKLRSHNSKGKHAFIVTEQVEFTFSQTTMSLSSAQLSRFSGMKMCSQTTNNG
jgi:hypothetical protein